MDSWQSDDCKWLIVEWESGERDIVYAKSVVSPSNEPTPGDVLTVPRNNTLETATLIAYAGDRDILDQMVRVPQRDEEAGPSKQNDEEAEPFFSSESSWEPSDDCSTQSDDSEDEITKVNIVTCKKYYNRRPIKKVVTPSRRVTPVIPMLMEGSNNNIMMSHKREQNDSLDLSRNISNNKSLPDSSRSKTENEIDAGIQTVELDKRDLEVMLQGFSILTRSLDLYRRLYHLRVHQSLADAAKHVLLPVKVGDKSQTSNNETVEEEQEEENPDIDDLNRSDDNVLITNRYNNVAVKTAQNKGAHNDEWIRIGSGKTLIHRDKFKRVNWKSFTIATRTLLLAVFPRRVLATHSLTGKKSPAFQNKPAKMCLDPKKISDVIMEIMDRFNVRENYIRNVITTKCADECKMWKTRLNKKKSQNNENIPPPPSNMEEQ